MLGLLPFITSTADHNYSLTGQRDLTPAPGPPWDDSGVTRGRGDRVRGVQVDVDIGRLSFLTPGAILSRLAQVEIFDCHRLRQARKKVHGSSG